jgi:phospholipase/carboxylesterase
MAHSLLVYQEVPETGRGVATLIGLHGRGGDLHQLVPLAREMGPVQLVAPQAARPAGPSMQGDSTTDGFTWYLVQDGVRPEPATFGEGLWLVEQFIYDVRDRQSTERPMFLFGYDQGAVLALTLAVVLPHSLAGVAAICGYLPEIRDWSPPIEDLEGLPVLLIHDPDDLTVPLTAVEKTAEELRQRQAEVELVKLPGTRKSLLAAAHTMRTWLEGHRGGRPTRRK